MPPASHGDVPKTKQERNFLRAAQASARLPSTENRRKAREAFNKLPESSPFKQYKFEG